MVIIKPSKNVLNKADRRRSRGILLKNAGFSPARADGTNAWIKTSKGDLRISDFFASQPEEKSVAGQARKKKSMEDAREVRSVTRKIRKGSETETRKKERTNIKK